MGSKLRWVSIICLSSLLLFLSGCWDYTDLEERKLEVGEAIDFAGMQDDGNVKITLTSQNVVPKAIASRKEGGQQKSYENLSTTNESVYKAWHKLFVREVEIPIETHLKVVVISDELAHRVNLHQLLMSYFRDTQIRYSTLLFIAQGSAQKILEAGEEVPAFDLAAFIRNRVRTSEILPERSLQKVSAFMAAESSFLLQLVALEDNQLRFVGTGVIKGKSNKLIGTLSQVQTSAVNWLTGTIDVDTVRVKDHKTQQPIVLKTKSIKSNIQPHVQGEKINFTVNIQAEGELKEDWLLPGDAFNNELLQRAEKATEEELTRRIYQTLDKLQHEYRADVIGFGKRLRIEYPEVWKKVKENWDEEFSKSKIYVTVKMDVKDYRTKGTKKKLGPDTLSD